MFKLKRLDGTVDRVGVSYLESLRMLADWQIRQRGYDPASVNAALISFDSIWTERCRTSA